MPFKTSSGKEVRALENAWLALADADPWLRYVTRTVIEHKPLET